MKKTLMIAATAMALTTSAYAGYDHDGKDWKHKIDGMVSHHIEKTDKNGDNMLSKAEVMDQAEEMFNEADANNDDMLTKEEMVDAKMDKMEKMKEKWHDKKDRDHDKKRHADPDIVDE